MPKHSYSLVFQLKGQKLRLTVYRLIKIFKYSLALTRLEKVSDGEGPGTNT